MLTANQLKKYRDKLEDQIFQAYHDRRAEWREETKVSVLKGKKKKVLASITRLIDSLGPKRAEAFREAMDITGAGDHPAVIDFLYRVSRKIKC